jgi:mono/diheme cytochrome c family protein
VRIRRSAGALALALAAGCGGGEKPAAGSTAQPAQTGALAGVVVTGNDPRAALFLTKGCPQCHSISALGIKSPAEVGPDLTNAYTDVQTRFGVKLEEFLVNPTGTMQVVLSTTIQLSPAERDSVIKILRELDQQATTTP